MVDVFDEHLQVLQKDRRIATVSRQKHGLIVSVDGRSVSVMQDFQQARTLVWAVVRRLAPAEIGPAATAATRFNRDCFACDGLALGVMADENLLTLGRSLDGAAIPADLLVEAVLEVRGAVDDALDRFMTACGATPSLVVASEGETIIRA